MERNIGGKRKRLLSDACDSRFSYSPFHRQDSSDLPHSRTRPNKRMCRHSDRYSTASAPFGDNKSIRGRGRGRRGRVKQMHHHHQGSNPECNNREPFKSRSPFMKGYFNKASCNFRDGKTVNRSFRVGGDYSCRDKSWLENIRPISTSEIVELAALQPEKLITKIYAKIKVFQETLSKSTLTKNAIMDTILQILLKTSTFLCDIPHTTSNDLGNKACQILGEVLSERCAVFQFNLKLYISNLKELNVTHSESSTLEQKIKTICTLFLKLLQILPDSSWSVLPVNELKCKVDEVLQLPHSSETGSDVHSLNSMMHDIISLRELARAQHTTTCTVVENASQNWNNYDYRNISIIPRWDEICCTSYNPSTRCLRKNIVQGSYSDWLHYFDIHFRLLREDFIAPFRSGISDYIQGLRGRKLKNVRIYESVLLIRPLSSESGICYKISIGVSRVHSNRLLFGSLLCLSPDGFKDHIFFATVVSRETMLKKKELDIKFQDTAEVLKFRGQSFVMVESSAYFEGSRQILLSLQAAEANTMPFTKYLIAGECNSVNEPHYLTEESNTSYDLRHLLAKCKDRSFVEKRHINGEAQKTNDFDLYSQVDMRNISSWPSLDLVGLDKSQMKALQNALTQELALIQGPPGTGKTFIGLKLVETLLKNCLSYEESPILVMCYTNHALDQFLEGILACPLFKGAKDNTHIVRVGSKSKSEKLDVHNIRHLRKNARIPPSLRKNRSRIFGRIAECKESVEKLFCEYELIQSNSIVSFHKLVKFMHPDHHYYFIYGKKTEEQQEYFFLTWQCNQFDPQIVTSAHFFKDDGPNFLLGEISQVHVPALKGDHEDIAVHYGNEIGPSDQQFEVNHVMDSNGKAACNIVNYEREEKKYGCDLIDVVKDDEIELHQRILDDDDDYSVTEFKETKKLNFCRRLDFAHHKPDINAEYPPEVAEYQQKDVRVDKKCAGIEPMTEKSAMKIRNIGELSIINRYRLYKYWHSLYQDHVFKKCGEELKKYNKLCSELEHVRREVDQCVLEHADLIGMTTTGAARYQRILNLVKPKIVIIEEAAEILESHIVSALNAGTQHLVLIGDHKQLRPKPNVYNLSKKYRLDVSLFERLILNNHPHVTLTIQHRMRPEIAELVKPHIYDILLNHSSVENYPNIRGVSTNLYFISHDKPEHTVTHLLSHSNDHEAKYLVAFCQYLLQQNYAPNQITILVTYSGQLLAMRELMPKNSFNGVRLSTVDNFQGEENDIILLSLVRSNSSNQVGFLAEENRVCVALSRARQGFFCIGNFKMLRHQAPIWEAIMSDMESKSQLGDGLLLQCNNHPKSTFVAKDRQDFIDHSPNGGCRNICMFRLQCGHACSEICHNIDPEHTNYRCMKPCSKYCPDGHPCDEPCWIDCKCKVSVTRSLSCGHEKRMHCHIDPITVKCTQPCKKTCPKRGHLCPLKCFEECYVQCLHVVTVEMPSCLHKMSIKCYMDDNLLCTSRCSHKCPEGHSCPKKCYEPCGSCEVQVLKTIPECKHKVMLPCHVECDHENCIAPCTRLLSCKHLCPNRCNEPCGKSLCEVQVLKTIPECNHEVMLPCHVERDHENCIAPCTRLLSCKHLCPNRCNEPCGKSLCEVQVLKTIPECNHKVILPCHTEPVPKNCTESCKKVLPCKHKCELKCGVLCSTVKCQVPVQIELQCHHQADVPCWNFLLESDYLSFDCEKECNRKLPCGHKCGLKCNEACKTRCEVNVKKIWPCGHFLTKLCYQTQNHDDYPCGMKCKKKLPCNHLCPMTCGEPCIEKCLVNVEKEYPCGHLVKAACSSTPSESPCNEMCQQLLPCGHACGGECSLCKNIHKPCSFRVQLKRFCGHTLNTSCTGLDDPTCGKAIKVSCSHGSYNDDCLLEPNYLSCNKPCEWNCAHFACSKTCADICNRPRCDEYCQQKLKCGHQCYGLCGEPCLSICPKCQLKSFNNKLKSPSSFDRNERYYQLPCGHIFTVKYLDEFTQHVYHTSTSSVLVTPLLCSVETCSMPLSNSFRYGNAVKTSFKRLQDVINHIRIESERHNGATDELIGLLGSMTRHRNCFGENWFEKPVSVSWSWTGPNIGLQIREELVGSSMEKKFLFFLLCKTWMLDESLQIDAETCGIQEELKNFEKFLRTLIFQYKSCLTYSVVRDLEKEFLRLCLTLQCLEIRHCALDHYPALIKTETFLKDAALKKVKVTRKDFRSNMRALSKHSSFASLSTDMKYEKLLTDLDLFYPKLLKGSWWCHPEGHYNCTPASMLHNAIEHQCLECKGNMIIIIF